MASILALHDMKQVSQVPGCCQLTDHSVCGTVGTEAVIAWVSGLPLCTIHPPISCLAPSSTGTATLCTRPGALTGRPASRSY